MNLMEEIISKRWILKKEEEHLYYEIKDHAKQMKRLFQDKFGYNLIINPYLVKLEKIPGKPEAWMGIQAFESIMEYRMFCMLLMFLEEKEIEEVFVLSMLTEYIQVQLKDDSLDWLNFTSRRQLVRVVRYAVEQSLLVELDGDAQRFAQSVENEVLYKNTGISRYFMRDFTVDIMQYQKPEDFAQSEWIDMEEDRGIVRKQRVYRRMLLSCGIYKYMDKDDDMGYVRNYRRIIEQDFQQLCNCHLDTHASSAYLVLDENTVGEVFPKRNTMYDIVLLVQKRLQDDVKKQKLIIDEQEVLHMDKDAFLIYMEQIFYKHEEQFPKSYRDKGKVSIARDTYDMLRKLGFVEEEDHMVAILPIVAKLYGDYEGGKSNVNK